MSNGPHTMTRSSNGLSAAQLTQQQVMQLKQQQQQQQLQQQLRLKAGSRNAEFASTSEDILKKYAKYPPSLTFHIYENHYKFNNSQESNVIPRDSPMAKDFLKHILKEEIPVEMSELIKDFAIKSYDGCIILQVYDHRNIVPLPAPEPAANGTAPEASGPPETKPEEKKPVNGKPKTYRTLLRPTQLSLYYDLLYHTDSALTKFTDPLALQMESEILTLTNRKLDLSVPLNPYLQDDLYLPHDEYPKKVWDDKTNDYKTEFVHREAKERPDKKLHQEELVLHKASEYEEIMFLLSNKYKKTDDMDRKLVVVGNTSSISSSSGVGGAAPDTPSKSKEGTSGPELKSKKIDKVMSASNSAGTMSTTGQFMRLRFIEEIRKRKEAQKAQKDATVAMQAGSGINTINQNSSISGPSPEKHFNGKPAPTPRPVSAHPENAANNQQQMLMKAQALRAQQLQNQQMRLQQQQPQMQQQQQQMQQQVKRQKMSPQVQQSMQNSPSFNNAPTPQMAGSSQPGSSMGTPVMGRSVSNPRMQQIQQQQVPMNNAMMQGNQMPQQIQQPQQQGSGQQPTSAYRQAVQQQQQQIFQSTLTPQEQQAFRQLQTRMNALAVMGNTGVAPNRTQLSPQQQQQAIAQAKAIQQQLIQKFPLYFQRLRQFQLLQQQRQQQQKQQMQQQQQQQQVPQQMQQQFSPDMNMMNNAQAPINMQAPMKGQFMEMNKNNQMYRKK